MDNGYYIDAIVEPEDGWDVWVAIIKGPNDFELEVSSKHYNAVVRKSNEVVKKLNESV